MLVEIPSLDVAADGVDLVTIHDRRIGDLKDAVIGEMFIGYLAGGGVQNDRHCCLVGVWKIRPFAGAGDTKGDVAVVGADRQCPMGSYA